MSKIQNLASQLMALDDRIIGCMKCGICQSTCPMFGATLEEADVARGKLALIDNLAHRVIEDPEAVMDKLGRCLMCGSCQTTCPAGVKTMDLFLEARELVAAYIGLHPIKKMVFRVLLAKPSLFNLSMRIGAPLQGLIFRKTGQIQETACAPMLNNILGDRHIRKLAPKSLEAKYGELNSYPSAKMPKIAFFPGCMGDKFYTDMAEACIKVFRHHGVGIFMPKGLACCGMPAAVSGDMKGLVSQMASNLETLKKEEFDYLITPCSSCTSAIKELWAKYANRLDAGNAQYALEVSKKTMDINDFVINILKVQMPENRDANSIKITYHDSCHLKKSLGISAEPRAVATLNPKYDLVEMNAADSCCGCGGSFNLFHYDLSKKIGQKKRDNIVATNAQIATAGCPACMMQLEDMLSRNNDNIAVKHVIELYAETL